MTTRKVILLTLILPVLYSALMLRGTAGQDMSEKAIWVCIAFAFWAAGLLAAVILTVIFKRPKAEPWFYLFTQLILPMMFVAYMIASGVNERKHERDFGNVDDNHNLLDIRNPELSPDMQHVRTAFVKLESTSSNPNSIVLMKYRSYWRDTVIGEHPDTMHRVYFTYLKDKRVHWTKVMVLGDSAVIDSLELSARPTGGYPGWHFAFRGGSLAGLDDVKKILRDEPQWVQDTVISILSH